MRATQDLLVQAFGSVLDESSALYCSTPITTGKRFFDWLDRLGASYREIDDATDREREAHVREVIEPNVQRAREVVARLRHQANRPVIDPTAIPHIPGWTQDEWRSFWERVIERYANAVVFVDDWQFSNGCAYEFLVAQRKEIPTLAEDGRPLDLDTGISMVADAIADLQRRGAETRSLERTLIELRSLRGDRVAAT